VVSGLKIRKNTHDIIYKYKKELEINTGISIPMKKIVTDFLTNHGKDEVFLECIRDYDQMISGGNGYIMMNLDNESNKIIAKVAFENSVSKMRVIDCVAHSLLVTNPATS
jgi:hypothetical protein